MNKVRIGSGAGYAGDRIAPAIDLIERGVLHYIAFECLAERTIALAQQTRMANPDLGYDPMLERRLRQVLPACRRQGTRLISNMGAANPRAAAAKTCAIAETLGLSGLKIASIEGDDVLPLFASPDLLQSEILETGQPVSSLEGKLISANAYIGAEPIIACLQNDSHVILGGRIADPALFLAPLMFEFDWDPADWNRLGAGILTGHLLECAGQLSGGYFADPPYKDVPGLANLGFPYADVEPGGAVEFGKLENTGGIITVATCKEQLLYEIHDPAHYLTPDVTADFSQVSLEQRGPDRVRAEGAAGTPKPHQLKVSLGYSDGYIGEGQITYAGAGALLRAELAIEIVRQQLARSGCRISELRCDLIGMNSILPTRKPSEEPPEIRVRIAGRANTAEEASLIGATVEALYTNGPSGGGGAARSIRPVVAVASTFIPRRLVQFNIEYQVAQ